MRRISLLLLLAIVASVYEVHRIGVWGLVTKRLHLSLIKHSTSAAISISKSTAIAVILSRSSSASSIIASTSTTLSLSTTLSSSSALVATAWFGGGRCFRLHSTTATSDEKEGTRNTSGEDDRGSETATGEKNSLDYSEKKYSSYQRWDRTKRALLAYKSKEKNLRVPKPFVIPKDDASWDRDLWETKLGNTVYGIRNKNAYKDHRQELEDMGFDFDYQRYGWDMVKRALLVYKSMNNDTLLVPTTFTVPVDDPSWGKDLWGMKLGYTVINIRNRNDYSKHRQELLAMGFEYDPQLILYGWPKVKMALLAYENWYRGLLVPQKFIIPISSLMWEPDLWEMKLGAVVKRIRNRGDHNDHKQELLEMGFDYSSQQGKGRTSTRTRTSV